MLSNDSSCLSVRGSFDFAVEKTHKTIRVTFSVMEQVATPKHAFNFLNCYAYSSLNFNQS